MSASDPSVNDDKAIASIGRVSKLLRDAIGASLPVAPEQYLTITVPGTVIDLTPIEQGGTYVYDTSKYVVAPTQVRQAEAKLVDGMMPLAKIMIGNTGKSVARSYSEALDTLIASKATLSVGNQIRSPGNKEYDDAMEYLTSVDPKSHLSPVEVYGLKQEKWAKAQDDWDQARSDALKAAQTKNPDDHVAALQAYNDWNQTHFRRYKSAVQAAWMDWVSNGHKYDVEYSFGTVDIDSIMARLEQSKESMRNSALVDTDGANEVAGVELTPKSWATMCQTVKKQVPSYTLDQLDTEIARLKRLQGAYNALVTATQAEKDPYPGAPAPTGDINTIDKDVATKLSDLLTSQATLNSSKETDESKLKPLQDDVNAKRTALATAQGNQSTAMAALDKFNMANGDKDNKAATKTWLEAQLATVADQLKQLDEKRITSVKSGTPSVPVVIGATADTTETAPNDAQFASPVFGTTGGPPSGDGDAATTDNAWTEITMSFSAQSQSQDSTTKSWGMSVSGGVGFGLWSVGGSYAHEQSSSDMQSDMSSCDVNISFQALVVNIRRPWLYGELFNDHQLDSANQISPGPEKLQSLLSDPEGTKATLATFNLFPAYPTSFILAANTTIEFHGNTQHIEQHMSSHSNSGSASVGYGPWSVSSSFHESASHQSFSMESTSTGCKLNFTSPQIIGWVSQILPQLPRDPDFEPMIQNVVKS